MHVLDWYRKFQSSHQVIIDFSVTVFHDLNMQPMSDTGNQYNSNNIVNIVTSPTKH